MVVSSRASKQRGKTDPEKAREINLQDNLLVASIYESDVSIGCRRRKGENLYRETTTDVLPLHVPSCKIKVGELAVFQSNCVFKNNPLDAK